MMMILCCAACAEAETPKVEAYPKVTILDTKCGNTTEYISSILTNNDLKSNGPMTSKTANYIYMFKNGTFLIENDGEAAVISILEGRPIYSSSVLIKDE